VCRPEDAIAAGRAGADAIGMVFDRSSGRYVSMEDAARIAGAAAPFVSTIGLFVNAPIEEIRRVASELALSAVQLQGEESPQIVASLKPLRIIKALHLSGNDAEPLARWRTAVRDLSLSNLVGILLDTPGGTQRGGTGIPNDFGFLRRLQESGSFDGLPPIIIAGGLKPETVGDVVRLLHPYAVDVSSGVETAKREKSPQKIEAFIRAVREADSAL
jgi:phosphoribosylanthranilate isomerase